MADIMDLKYTRLVIGETLRMYPEPPHLIRRCRTEDVLPQGCEDNVRASERASEASAKRWFCDYISNSCWTCY